jgi:hypothetical protein
MTDGNRQNQISWQQFSIRHRDNESARDDFLNERRKEECDNQDERFDIQVSTTKNKAHTVQKHKTIRKRSLQSPTTPENKTVPVKQHEQIQKSKTRAARRAIDTIAESSVESSKPKHKERRSNYWVHRDSLRMNQARKFKSHFSEQTECLDGEEAVEETAMKLRFDFSHKGWMLDTTV